ncbi:MAG: hypothetical protein J7L39_02270 [Candidatus Aenigmarchaeota archaeon]|nr:hypothetical protein [Candidatus Aenigmarchaeota archaeon]
MEITVTTTEEERIYDIPELGKLPSSTTILRLMDKSFVLVPWASKLVAEYFQNEIVDKIISGEIKIEDIKKKDPKEFVKEAKSQPRLKKEKEADKGSRVHLVAEMIFKAMLKGYKGKVDFEVEEDIEKPVEALLKWISDYSVKPVEVEKIVWSKDFGGYAGRLDLVAEVEGYLLTIDIKSSSGIYAEFPLQVASYDYAWKCMTGKTTEGIAVLRLDKETGMPEFKYWDIKQANDYLNEFGLWCLIWHIRNERKEREKALKKAQKIKEKLLKEKTDEEPF